MLLYSLLLEALHAVEHALRSAQRSDPFIGHWRCHLTNLGTRIVCNLRRP